jgi:FkbM family methyltransferase
MKKLIETQEEFKTRVFGNIKPNKRYANYITTEVVKSDCYRMKSNQFNEYDAIFDIGANIGIFSIYANSIFPNTPIIAFEPTPQTFGYLQENIKNYCPSVKAEKYGVGEKTAMYDVFKRTDSFTGDWCIGFSHKDTNRLSDEKALLLSIEEFIERLPNVKDYFVKLDCEGGEMAFLNSEAGRRFLLNAKTAVIEVHCWKEKKSVLIQKCYDIFGNDIEIAKAMSDTFMVHYSRK